MRQRAPSPSRAPRCSADAGTARVPRCEVRGADAARPSSLYGVAQHAQGRWSTAAQHSQFETPVCVPADPGRSAADGSGGPPRANVEGSPQHLRPRDPRLRPGERRGAGAAARLGELEMPPMPPVIDLSSNDPETARRNVVGYAMLGLRALGIEGESLAIMLEDFDRRLASGDVFGRAVALTS